MTPAFAVDAPIGRPKCGLAAPSADCHGRRQTACNDWARDAVSWPYIHSYGPFAMDMPELPESPDDASVDGSSEGTEPSSGPFSRYRLQLISTLATLLVAVSAVGLSVWEGLEMRQHNRLSVLPNLEIETRQLTLEPGAEIDLEGTQDTIEDTTFALQIAVENSGLGPAVFERVLLYRANASSPMMQADENGEAINLYGPDSLRAQIRAAFPEFGAFYGALQQGFMLRPGASEPFLQANIPAASVPDTAGYPPGRVLDMISRYSFVVCYCSVYGEDCDVAHIGAEPPANACRL